MSLDHRQYNIVLCEVSSEITAKGIIIDCMLGTEYYMRGPVILYPSEKRKPNRPLESSAHIKSLTGVEFATVGQWCFAKESVDKELSVFNYSMFPSDRVLLARLFSLVADLT